MELKFQVRAKVSRPITEVFDAVYDPAKLTKYFTTGGASGPPAEGSEVVWRFADYPSDVPITVKKCVPGQVIVLEWDAADSPPSYKTQVEMAFEALPAGSTLVTVTEFGWRETQQGLNSSYENCQGWMNMLSCLKAWVEYGINLRQGFF
jgi:uncharacterized protein YndB with AHSA1/START domain